MRIDDLAVEVIVDKVGSLVNRVPELAAVFDASW